MRVEQEEVYYRPGADARIPEGTHCAAANDRVIATQIVLQECQHLRVICINRHGSPEGVAANHEVGIVRGSPDHDGELPLSLGAEAAQSFQGPAAHLRGCNGRAHFEAE